IERREGVDAVIAGEHRLVFRRPGRVPRREDIGIDRLLGARHQARLADVVDEASVMDSSDVAIGIARGRHPLEQTRRIQFCQDRANADRRLDIAAVLHVMDGVLVVEYEGYARLARRPLHVLLRSPWPRVTWLAQFDG